MCGWSLCLRLVNMKTLEISMPVVVAMSGSLTYATVIDKQTRENEEVEYTVRIPSLYGNAPMDIIVVKSSIYVNGMNFL